MTSIQPDQAAFLFQVQLPGLQNEHRSTFKVIDAIPTKSADYKPDPLSKTALELAWHVAAAEQRFFSGVAAGAFDFAPIHKPDTIHTGPDIAAWFDASWNKNLEALTKLSGEQLAKILDFRGAFQCPAVSFLDFAVRHSIHHRGQLSTYLRAMGGKVPSIYGESYDSAEAKKSAQAS